MGEKIKFAYKNRVTWFTPADGSLNYTSVVQHHLQLMLGIAKVGHVLKRLGQGMCTKRCRH